IESIDKITAEHLYTCYNTFYHPSNMLLFVVGAVNPEEMIQFIKENQDKKEFKEAEEIERHFEDEPTEVATKARELKMDVQKPKVYVGFKAKQTDLSGEEMLKHELSVQIGLECLFGRASDFYTKVYEAGLIDESYAYDFSLEKGFGFAIVGSDSAKPDQLAESIIEEMNKAQFNEEAIERVKRKKIGFYLRALNSIEFIANQF
ncbi:insulinase family protein, partial [Butyricicoccus sp. 1XD8-22]